MVPGSARLGAASLVAAAMVSLGLVASAEPASARTVEVGVYQDRPASGVPVLARKVGPRAARVVSVYVTAGKLVPEDVVKMARNRRARLLVSWMPDSGSAGAKQPRYRLSRVVRGGHDRGLRALARQLRPLRPAPILRPMPEMNTPWYPWSGTVNGGGPEAYRKAFTRVRNVVRGASSRRVKVMYAPYHRSIPEAEGNALEDYFPGERNVDLVGASGYNFGAKGGLAWADPDPLFGDAYRRLTALAAKPFWIAETGSTGAGGSKPAWMRGVRDLPESMPGLAGVVWYDVRDRNGDFRVRQSGATIRAFRQMASGLA